MSTISSHLPKKLDDIKRQLKYVLTKLEAEDTLAPWEVKEYRNLASDYKKEIKELTQAISRLNQ